MGAGGVGGGEGGGGGRGGAEAGRRRGGRRGRRGRAVGQVAPAVRPHKRYLGLKAVVDHTLLAVGKGVGVLPEGQKGRRGMLRRARGWRRRRAAGKEASLCAVARVGQRPGRT